MAKTATVPLAIGEETSEQQEARERNEAALLSLAESLDVQPVSKGDTPYMTFGVKDGPQFDFIELCNALIARMDTASGA